jgi:hypothetical protein
MKVRWLVVAEVHPHNETEERGLHYVIVACSASLSLTGLRFL